MSDQKMASPEMPWHRVPDLLCSVKMARILHRSTSVVLMSALAFGGCASLDDRTIKDPSESARPNPTALIVVPARFEPLASTDPVLRTKDQAAAEGMAKGAKATIGGALTAGDPYIIVLLPVFIPIGALIGAITETARAPSDEALAIGRQSIAKAIAQLQVQKRMQQAVMTELQYEEVAKSLSLDEAIGPRDPDDRPVYRDQTAPMALEVSVLEFGFTDRKGTFGEQTKAGKDGYALTLTTRARLLDTRSNTVLDEMKHFRRSEAFTPAEWMADDAARFRAKLEEAIQATADDIVLEFFLLYYPPKPAAAKDEAPAWGDVIPYYVLKPLYPEVKRGGLDLREMFSEKYVGGSGGMEFTRVDDVRPTFRWEPFPRAVDLAGGEAGRGRFTDVSYEIAVHEAEMNRLGRVKYFAAGPLRYLRKGLHNPEHRMEEPLEPCGRYAWTVRPRFKLDGQPRLGEWTGAYGISDLNPPPWKIRRALPPFETHGTGSREGFLLFRAPPLEGTLECPD